MDHLIWTRRPDLVGFNKKEERTCHQVDFAITVDHGVKIEKSKKIIK